MSSYLHKDMFSYIRTSGEQPSVLISHQSSVEPPRTPVFVHSCAPFSDVERLKGGGSITDLREYIYTSCSRFRTVVDTFSVIPLSFFHEVVEGLSDIGVLKDGCVADVQRGRPVRALSAMGCVC